MYTTKITRDRFRNLVNIRVYSSRVENTSEYESYKNETKPNPRALSVGMFYFFAIVVRIQIVCEFIAFTRELSSTWIVTTSSFTRNEFDILWDAPWVCIGRGEMEL